MTEAEAAAHLHEVMVLTDQIIALENDFAYLLGLVRRAREALQMTADTLSYSTGYKVPDYIPELLNELRIALEKASE